MPTLLTVLDEIRNCQACSAQLPLGARPVLQAGGQARILIAGQAPGRKVHASGIPFADASGERLREWLGVTPAVFYNPAHFSIVPMGFCYPGTGRSGDLPPRAECAIIWRERILAELGTIELTLVVGRYALGYHLPDAPGLTSAVRDWRRHWPSVVPLPHPSPRNNLWLKQNPWFADEVLPALRERIAQLLG